MLAGGCLDEAARVGDGDQGRVDIDVAALSLEGVGDAVWDLEVRNGLSEVVWQRRITSAGFGDGAGSASYVGPCDAAPDAADNVVHIWVVGLYAAPVSDAGAFAPGSAAGAGAVTGAALDFTNPTADGPLSRTVTCVPNGDVAVTFDVTLVRQANQGFFDVAVELDDMFCSAKLDCQRDGGADLELLHHNVTGDRDMTAVLGFACTASPTGETFLYMNDPVITCTNSTFDARVDVTALGAVDLATAPSENGGYLFGASVYRGEEQLANKAYWNLSLGLEEGAFADAGDCRLVGRATASSTELPQELEGFPLPEATVYPVIDWNVSLSNATARVCTSHAVNDAGSGVATTYVGYLPAANQFTWSAGPIYMDARLEPVPNRARRGQRWECNPDDDEICDGVDNDCDEVVDNGCDDDGDGWCDAALVYTSSPACPNGGGDTDDTNYQINPSTLFFTTYGATTVTLEAGTYELFAWGAAGGPSIWSGTYQCGGAGGFARGTYVHPGGDVEVRVGQGGAHGEWISAWGGSRGGTTDRSGEICAGGGGYSGVFLPVGGALGSGDAHSRALLVAGGGGGRGYTLGAGGGTNGQKAPNSGNGGGGYGGTQTAGGAGGHRGASYGSAGSTGGKLAGGNGGTGSRCGGGGGGGYWGGGGGGSNNYMGAGGGGGSGFAHASLLTNRALTTGSGCTPAQSSHALRGNGGSSSTTRVVDGVRRGWEGRVVIVRLGP